MMASQEPSITPTPFRISIPKEKLVALRTLLENSPIPAPFYEGQHANFGVTTAWMTAAKDYWLNSFDWTEYENTLNTYPHFLLTDPNTSQTLHFLHHRCANASAPALLLLHGWPSSFAEFLPLIPHLAADFHLVIPSLPGFCFSTPPPLAHDFTLAACAAQLDTLMQRLGYAAYHVHGGDLGAFLGRLLGAGPYPAVRGVHATMVWVLPRAELAPPTSLPAREQEGLRRGREFASVGSAYALEHATRPATIAHVLAASPLALLAWVGEKFLAWTHAPPPLRTVVEAAALCWLTATPATAVWAYRDIFLPARLRAWNRVLPGEALWIRVPMGVSSFASEIVPVPRKWAEMTGRMVFWRWHEKGGHFPAFETPETLALDLREFVDIVEKSERAKL
ncbi:hypothetical protein FN846DRAFT_989114 [Sphaerosporella brunnea]|uniref:Epoxide hydrolase N-terminal domain-containing protein n=1 Tax=Sphaerosporella brunnea TaxID=1250544 RepID=A0A5J5ER83_9PEZI|nr:hypothetical protein FN846DRAFT_989114 [Sphaerosporella brunnea]